MYLRIYFENLAMNFKEYIQIYSFQRMNSLNSFERMNPFNPFERMNLNSFISKSKFKLTPKDFQLSPLQNCSKIAIFRTSTKISNKLEI